MRALGCRLGCLGLVLFVLALVLVGPVAAAEGDALIPSMTSATSPSGTVTASSTYQAFVVHGAFTGTGASWVNNGGWPAWLGYQFASPQRVGSYSVLPFDQDNFGTRYMSAWALQGSADGATWTDVDVRAGYTGWSAGTAAVFTLGAAAEYAYWRVYATAGPGGYLGIKALQLYEAAPAAGASPSASPGVSPTPVASGDVAAAVSSLHADLNDGLRSLMFAAGLLVVLAAAAAVAVVFR